MCIIIGNGYIEARELDPFLQELFEARYHVSTKSRALVVCIDVLRNIHYGSKKLQAEFHRNSMEMTTMKKMKFIRIQRAFLHQARPDEYSKILNKLLKREWGKTMIIPIYISRWLLIEGRNSCTMERRRINGHKGNSSAFQTGRKCAVSSRDVLER